MAAEKVANPPLGSYPVLVDRNTAGSDMQVIRLDIGVGTAESRVTPANPLPVTGTVVTSGLMVTFTPSRVSIPNNASTSVIAANSSRVPGSYIFNNSATVSFYLQYGAAAVLNEGVLIYPQQGFIFNTTQEIFAIQNSGGAVTLDVFEAT